MDATPVTFIAHALLVLQLGTSLAFCAVFWLLHLRLFNPTTDILAVAWTGRLFQLTCGYVYWALPTRWSVAGALLNVGIGVGVGVFAMGHLRALDHAATPDNDSAMLAPSPFVWAALIGGIASLAVYCGGRLPWVASAPAGFLTGRAVLLAAYMLLGVRGAVCWRRAPDRRFNTWPFLAAVASGGTATAADAYFRSRLLSFNGQLGIEWGALASALVGTIAVGTFVLYATLIGEREILNASARRAAALARRTAEQDRLGSLGQLATGIAHDFNNILSVVAGSLLLIKRQLDSARAEASAELLVSRQIVEQGKQLTGHLLQFAKRRTDSPKRVRPGESVEAMRPLLDRLVGRRIALNVHIARHSELHIDPVRLEQILLNLVANARDAIDREGSITVSLGDTVNSSTREARVGRLVPGRYVQLTISDSGAGIAPASLQQIFDRFFTTKGEAGTGLGLSTVADAVLSASGALDVRSELGRGTTFFLWFPALSD